MALFVSVVLYLVLTQPLLTPIQGRDESVLEAMANDVYEGPSVFECRLLVVPIFLVSRNDCVCTCVFFVLGCQQGSIQCQGGLS